MNGIVRASKFKSTVDSKKTGKSYKKYEIVVEVDGGIMTCESFTDMVHLIEQPIEFEVTGEYKGMKTIALIQKDRKPSGRGSTGTQNNSRNAQLDEIKEVLGEILVAIRGDTTKF